MSQPSSKISPLGNYREAPNKAYISTRPFDSTSNPTGTLYSYATSLNGNYQTVGALTLNTNASATNCPARRLLHLNGKMLIPGVNPGGGSPGVDPTTGTGTSTPATLPFPMVGVYDPVSGLNGYINPQDTTWGVYDATLGATYDLGLVSPDNTLAGNGTDNDVPSSVGAYITTGYSTTNGSPVVTVTTSTITGSVRVGQVFSTAAYGNPTGFGTTPTVLSITTSGANTLLTMSANATSTQAGPLSAILQFGGVTGSPAVSYVGQAVAQAVATVTVFNSNVKTDSVILFSLNGAVWNSAAAGPTVNVPVITAQSSGQFTITWTNNFTGFVNYQVFN